MHYLVYVLIAFISLSANILAFAFQFLFYELPCPLCLLQRFGFLSISFSALLSLKYDRTWKYDLMVVLSCCYTLIVALRQVLLHIAPNDLGYGSMLLGLHCYTWSAIVSFAIIIIIATIPTFNIVLIRLNINLEPFFILRRIVYIVLTTLLLVNILMIYFECGFGMCQDNPIEYLELLKIRNLLFTSWIK